MQAPLPPGQLLQVDCLLQAWPPQGPGEEEEEEKEEEESFHQREALHVQSLSHWAPANIGPYSQALRVGAPPRVGRGGGLRDWGALIEGDLCVC